MSNYFGPPEGTTPPEQSDAERYEEQRERERQQDRIAGMLTSVDCYQCEAENDEPNQLCAECQADGD